MLIFSLLFSLCFSAEFSIASYNLHNLFDAKATLGHEDFTYLPKDHSLKKNCLKEKNSYYKRLCLRTDWSEKKIDLRIKNLQKVMESFPVRVSLLALVEVETLEVAKKLGLPFGLSEGVITTGRDRRGIQSVLLFNPSIWKLLEVKEHSFDFQTRNLLEVKLIHKKEKKPIVVFVNHWPSQRSPTEKRGVLAKKLKERVKALSKERIIALGDFNTLAQENPHPIHQELLKDGLLKEFPFRAGTYFYAPSMSWNALDRLFYSENLKVKEAKVIKPSFATTVYEYKDKKKPFWGSRIVGVPKKANPQKKKKLGFSDHFPIFARMEF